MENTLTVQRLSAIEYNDQVLKNKVLLGEKIHPLDTFMWTSKILIHPPISANSYLDQTLGKRVRVGNQPLDYLTVREREREMLWLTYPTN